MGTSYLLMVFEECEKKGEMDLYDYGVSPFGFQGPIFDDRGALHFPPRNSGRQLMSIFCYL